MASEAGGMDIEAVAEKPRKNHQSLHGSPAGIQPYHLREAAFGLNIPKAAMKPFTGQLLNNLYNLSVPMTVRCWKSIPWC
jgi:succinyl-CoA synthetase beta subunit